VDAEPAHLGQKIDVETAVVEVDGVRLPVRPDLLYLLLYKPVGVISTADDPQGRTTVVDLVDPGVRVYPVGRLDADSEGLLLLISPGSRGIPAGRPSGPWAMASKSTTVRPGLRRPGSSIGLAMRP